MSHRPSITRRTFLAAGAATAVTAKANAFGAWNNNPSLQPDWKQQGVIDLRKSPHAKLRTVPVRAVTMHDGFWTPRRTANVEKSLPTMHTLLEEHGRMNNFRRLLGQSSAPQIGPVYSDSDVYKWTEAASFAQQSGDPALFQERIDAITKLIMAIQESNGYLNTYYVADRKPLRMTHDVQTTGHELYNIGHLMQGAVAQYRATGDPRLLECCMRFVDGFLIPGYGPDASKQPIISGHPEIEMGLIELYRVTGERRYLDLAGYILEGDTRAKLRRDQIVYMYSGVPFTSRTKLEGHAVRAMYACCGATDYLMETGDDRYVKTLSLLWEDLAHRQMYVNGGVGARRQDEAFGDPYELPNTSAYGESCAAIGNMMWNWRMLHATGDAKHADIMERALYNGINSGMSLEGTLYCYRNPLAFDAADPKPIRNAWYDTTCCPPNIERTFASLPGYMYSTSADGLYVHLFHNSTMDWKLENGTPIRVEQQTGYPWDGRIRVIVSPAQETRFTLYVRVPGWSKGTKVTVAGKPVDGVTAGKYLAIERMWKPGEVVEMTTDLAPHLVLADHHVAEDQGKVAVQRGPLLYCAEDLDQPSKASVRDLRLTVSAKPGSQFTVKHENTLLGGVDVLEHPGIRTENVNPNEGQALYSELASVSASPTTVRYIPYYSWANRGQAGMAVWVPVQKA